MFNLGNNSRHSTSKATRAKQKVERLGEERINNQGCLMRVVEYNNAGNIIVEFQDEYKGRVNSRYKDFIKGSIKNPYYPNVYGGMIGVKYPSKANGKVSKEYFTWHNMLMECTDHTQETFCCKEWLLFENFYEWMHEQSNFDKFLNGNKWTLSKEIIKNNNVYSPDTCYLVSPKVKQLFIKQELNIYDVPEIVLKEYKEHKERIIKRIAEEEFAIGNITKECYESMMDYAVDIIG